MTSKIWNSRALTVVVLFVLICTALVLRLSLLSKQMRDAREAAHVKAEALAHRPPSIADLEHKIAQAIEAVVLPRDGAGIPRDQIDAILRALRAVVEEDQSPRSDVLSAANERNKTFEEAVVALETTVTEVEAEAKKQGLSDDPKVQRALRAGQTTTTKNRARIDELTALLFAAEAPAAAAAFETKLLKARADLDELLAEVANLPVEELPSKETLERVIKLAAEVQGLGKDANKFATQLEKPSAFLSTKVKARLSANAITLRQLAAPLETRSNLLGKILEQKKAVKPKAAPQPKASRPKASRSRGQLQV